jgi:hypothetical protein
VERALIWLLCGLAACSIDVRAAGNDDGFVWVDANTKIRLKPIGSHGGAAAGGTTAGKAAAAEAPEPSKKETRKEKPKK